MTMTLAEQTQVAHHSNRVEMPLFGACDMLQFYAAPITALDSSSTVEYVTDTQPRSSRTKDNTN